MSPIITAFAPGMSYPNFVVLMRVSSASAASYQLVFIVRLIGNKRQAQPAHHRERLADYFQAYSLPFIGSVSAARYDFRDFVLRVDSI